MTTMEQALKLVSDQILCTTEYTKAVNRGNRGTMGYARRERKAAQALILALTGDKPTEAQLDEACKL